jgi:hypothetical protein
MSDALFDWIAAAWAATDQAKDGALLAVDHQLAIKSERQFTAARIAATTFPALDAASKAAPPVTVRLKPASITVVPGAGKLPLGKAKQRLWQAANFRLTVGGLDCTKVSRIESFTLPGALAAASAATWAAWFEDFVIDGNNGDAAEKSGQIAFLLPNLKTVLARIELHGLGIFRLDTAPGGPNQMQRMTAGLYCERMSLHRDTPSP